MDSQTTDITDAGTARTGATRPPIEIRRRHARPGTPETGEEVEVWKDRMWIGTGRLIGWVCRDRSFLSDGRNDIAYFTIGGEMRKAYAEDDVALPLVEDVATLQLIPEYPRCPDCGGPITWAEAGRAPGSRECQGDEGREGDEGCGSEFVDSRFGGTRVVPTRPPGAGETG